MTTVLAALLVALVVVVLATPTYGKRQAWEHDPEKSNEERSTRSSSALLVNERSLVVSAEKKSLARQVAAREREARAILDPQWRRCFWTRPFGHVRDGSTPYDLGHGREFGEVCLYCGNSYWRNVKDLEAAAAIAGRYPIALGQSKDTVTA